MIPIPRAERLIAALDVPTAPRRARSSSGWATRCGSTRWASSSSARQAASSSSHGSTERGHKVFADLKLHDIPETVRRAVANVRSRGATFLTVHGHRSVMEAAAGAKGPMKILAVTVLTSFDQDDLDEMGATKTVEQLVLARAKGAVEAGCDGVIASGHEAAKLKAEFGNRLLVVTPGIRPVGADVGDQKRTVDVAQAFAAGADYIVVGAADPARRPIRAPLPRRSRRRSLGFFRVLHKLCGAA
jgi:orotidine-5'-phosphate decarboxylase